MLSKPRARTSALRSKLLATTSALLAAVVLIGLGQGEVGRWFRAVGGGAAVGFAIAVFAKTQRDESGDLREISRRFGWGAIATVVAFAAIGGTVNLVLQHREAKDRHDAQKRANLARARAAVSQFVTGQGFWAGQPVVLDSAVKMFGTALDRRQVDPDDREGAATRQASRYPPRGDIRPRCTAVEWPTPGAEGLGHSLRPLPARAERPHAHVLLRGLLPPRFKARQRRSPCRRTCTDKRRRTGARLRDRGHRRARGLRTAARQRGSKHHLPLESQACPA